MNRASLFRDASVKRKLMFITFMSALAALLFAVVVLSVQIWVVGRTEMVSGMSILADVISKNSLPDLMAGDQKTVAKMMNTSAIRDEIEFVVIYDKDDRAFASFVSQGVALPHAGKIPPGDQHFYSARHLDLFYPIVSGGAKIGTLYIRASLATLYTEILRDIAFLLAAMLGGLGVAWTLVARLHIIITEPITELAGLMNQVTSKKNYALRAQPGGKDELGKLTEGFNEMLAEIQAQDDVLARNRVQLVQAVAQQTADLNESEEKFRTISASANDAILMMDSEGNISYWNTAAETVFGYPEAEALGKALHQLLAPERFHEAFRKGFSYFKNTGEGAAVGKTLELVALRKNGVEFPVELSLSSVKLGNHWSAIGILRDITERKLAEETVERLKNEMEMILESAGEGIITMDLNGYHILVNPSAARMLGYEVEEMIGRPSHSLWHYKKADGRPYPEEDCPIYATLREGTIHRCESEVFWRKDGTGFPVEYISTSIQSNGVITGVVIVFHDIAERKLAEELIHKQQELTTQIIETIPMRVFWKDRALHYLGCNTALARDAGENGPANLIGKDDFQLGWREQAEIYRADDRQVMETNTPKLSYDEQQTSSTGEDIWLRTSKVPLHNGAGEVIGVLGTYEDVTEHVKAQNELEWKNSVLFAQQEFSPDAILLVDDKTKIVFYNRRFVDMWNLPEEVVRAGLDQPVLQTTLMQMMDPEKELSRIEYLYEHREEKSHEELLVKDGRIVDRYSSAVVGEEGQYYGRVWYFRDITERKQAESILRESEERFRMAFQNSAIGMALVDVDGRWLKVNDALCRILGYAEQELLRKTFQDITHPDDLESDLNFVAQLLARKIDHYQMEKRYFHKDGHAVWALLSVSLLRDTEGKPIHFISQIEDITERKQAEEKIRRLNEGLEIRVKERTRQLMDAYEELVRKEKLAVLGQVAGSVGHELRNPLGVMSNAVYFLQTVLSDADETTREYLDIIKSEIAASERIVGDLLDSVRTKPPRLETAGVEQLIELSLGKCTVPSSVEIKLDIPARLPPLQVDSMQIHQVFRNLISNGMEAMPEGGALEIRALENEVTKNVTISVRDTGIGMTPEQLSNLFQPLFTTKARGIGLGLVVVKNLTEANGGSIEVQSEAGKGTVFSVTFPYDMENLA